MSEHPFTHLHVHTDASLMDGLGSVPRLLQNAKVIGFDKLAMTDHGSLANAVTFTIEANRLGIKPIIGLEGYVAFDGKVGHITLLADGQAGWNSLLELNNKAHASSYNRPAFEIDDLIAHQDGLICLTGCIASPMHQLPSRDAERLGWRLKGAFGHRLFAEFMFVSDYKSWERTNWLATRLKLKPVVTNDVHFPIFSDGAVHPVLTYMRAGFAYDSSQLYLKTPHQILRKSREWEIPDEFVLDGMARADAIADKLGVVSLQREPALPSIGTTTRDLRRLIATNPRATLLGHSTYADRLNLELDTIERMGYLDYFVILDDIIKAAKARDVRVGPGRGSGAGSLTLYLMGITDVDPIRYGLKFERFLNPSRKGMPDVDVDIESARREDVLEYANKQWDAIPISTYSRYSHRSLVRDLGRFYKADADLIGRAADEGHTSDAFRTLVDEHPEIEQAYDVMMGQIRHKGKHAGGVIITDTKVPVERTGDTLSAAWTEGRSNELSYAGVVKFDLLGLTALTALHRLQDKTGVTPPKPANSYTDVFDVFKRGDLSGIFQFSGSDGIRQLTIKLQPESFEELIAINALFRPGAIDAGATEAYPDWKKAPRRVPAYIADILEETYGAIVYQEQFMEVFARTVGGSLAEADDARRVIAKAKPGDPSWEAKIKALREQFIRAAISADVGEGMLSTREAQELWGELETHTRYSFNKSHSTAYSMIAWECAWYKAKFPGDFYATMLTVDPENEQTYILDALSAGFSIKPPNVQRSTDEWECDGSDIFMPLGAVRFLGPSGVKALVDARQALPAKQFADLDEFMKVVPKRYVRARAREGLWQLEGMSDLIPDTYTVDQIVEALALKTEPDPISGRERQLKYLGFIVPTRKTREKMEKLGAEGYTCGIVESSEVRTSRYGPYTVYRLSPNGVFWSRDVPDLDKGEVVAVRISEKNGKALTIEKI